MGAPTPQRSTTNPAPVKKGWAIYIFMKPDAALEAAAVADIEEMKRAVPGDDVHVIVQFERANDVERLSIEAGREVLAKSSPRRPTAEDNVGQFLAWASQQYPATRRMLVIWGHSRGVGIDLAGPSAAPEAVGLSRADLSLRRSPSGPPRDALRIPGLGRAISKLVESTSDPRASARKKPLDVLGFDACYMASLEYACELADEAEYVVAAQGYIKRSGWDYRGVLDSARDTGPIAPVDLASRIVEHAAALEGNTALSRIALNGIDLKAIRSASTASERAKVTGIAGAFYRLVNALIRVVADPIEARALRIALRRTSYLQVRQFLDVRDLCYRLADAFDGDIGVAAEAVLVEYEAMVESRATGTALGVLNGLSIYCPLFHAEPPLGGASVDVDAIVDRDEYADLAFVKFTGWLKLCDMLEQRTT
jgi:Clostripain family